jgi:hypothetical protein
MMRATTSLAPPGANGTIDCDRPGRIALPRRSARRPGAPQRPQPDAEKFYDLSEGSLTNVVSGFVGGFNAVVLRRSSTVSFPKEFTLRKCIGGSEADGFCGVERLAWGCMAACNCVNMENVGVV